MRITITHILAWLLLLVAAVLSSSCGIFRKRERHVEAYSRDSSGRTMQLSESLDTGRVRTYERWSFLVPADKIVDANRCNSPASKRGKSQMHRLPAGPKAKRPTSDKPDVSELIPISYERYTDEKRGTSTKQTTNQSAKVSEKAKVDNVSSKPDYSWIWWVAGVVAIGWYLKRRLLP